MRNVVYITCTLKANVYRLGVYIVWFVSVTIQACISVYTHVIPVNSPSILAPLQVRWTWRVRGWRRCRRPRGKASAAEAECRPRCDDVVVVGERHLLLRQNADHDVMTSSSSGKGICCCGRMPTTMPAVSPACVTYSYCCTFTVIVRPKTTKRPTSYFNVRWKADGSQLNLSLRTHKISSSVHSNKTLLLFHTVCTESLQKQYKTQ